MADSDEINAQLTTSRKGDTEEDLTMSMIEKLRTATSIPQVLGLMRDMATRGPDATQEEKELLSRIKSTGMMVGVYRLGHGGDPEAPDRFYVTNVVTGIWGWDCQHD